jgi:hypothetical protein
MRCKIVRFQKLMWRNMMRSTRNQKALVLHYSIDIDDKNYKRKKFLKHSVCPLSANSI